MRQAPRIAVVVLLSSAIAPAAFAQAGGRDDLAVSYSFVQPLDTESASLPGGGLFSGAAPLAETLLLVGQASASYRQQSAPPHGTFQLYTMQGGVRFRPRTNRAVKPFVQVLTGLSIETCCGELFFDWVVEPGGGVDIPLTPRMDFRVGAGVPMLLVQRPIRSVVRIHAGISWKLKRALR